MCGQIAACGQIAEMTKDLRMTWILIQEAALRERSDELADIAVNLFGQLSEAQAEISRLRAARYIPVGQHQQPLPAPAAAGGGLRTVA
jgi:hypothetical protein